MIRKRRDGLQVQVYAGRDPLTGRKRYAHFQQAQDRQAAEFMDRLLGAVATDSR